MPNFLLKEFSANLSVLYVEDDPVGAAIIRMMLEPFFANVYAANDGQEGLRQFNLHKPDLIITDLMMPLMDGIEMMREIRKCDQKTPVILMTASLEHVHLVEAINLRVSKFLAKPIRTEALQKALLAVTRELHLENVLEQTRIQEIELLQYRNRYHSLQQELAQSKEHHIARNLLKDSFLATSGRNAGWLVDLIQMPRDIMSGDSYSIIPTKKNTLLLFLADAMGHGLSASVTSMLTTAFFNYSAESYCDGVLDFPSLVQNTMNFASDNLLEEEVFSGLLMELDPEMNIARFAGSGMPAVLLVRSGFIERLRGGNPPVSSFSPPVKLQEFSLDGVTDILLATDGLTDVAMIGGGDYREQLNDDLLATTTAAELFERYRLNCNDEENDDDITLIRLIAISGSDQQKKFVCDGTLKAVEGLQKQVKNELLLAGAAGEKLDNLELALSEALMNAFEHGCLGIGCDKHRLILEGEYDDILMTAKADENKQISLELRFRSRQGRLQIWIELADPGAGFGTEQQDCRCKTATAPCGRGFMIMKRSVDLVRRSQKGNRLVLMQMFD